MSAAKRLVIATIVGRTADEANCMVYSCDCTTGARVYHQAARIALLQVVGAQCGIAGSLEKMSTLVCCVCQVMHLCYMYT